ncbi:chromate transporter [Caproicibacterium sp. BJN0003]|uniref:chromate transporter n=1 Tax=Caproicibacterium sp. BJN0003 TaxID=2994078 RepID=UPI002255E6C0|nr:chromate transporter [Caproicibacterium sp. BJN0003]UZT81225.1 chromate transporter [Caproicibacterium sp. BJN0003]
MKDYFELLAAFFRIGAFTFGGGYAMLPMLERELIINHKWSTMEELMDYFAVGQCTPGTIAVNTASFIGYKRKKIPGAIVATLGVILPSLIIIIILAAILQQVSDYPTVQSAFRGISAAVAALIVQSVWGMGKSGVKNLLGIILMILSFYFIFFLKVNPVWIVLGAGGIGAFAYSEIGKKVFKKLLTPFDKEESK